MPLLMNSEMTPLPACVNAPMGLKTFSVGGLALRSAETDRIRGGIFPAGALGGPDFIKAIRGPLPWLKTIPTGGMDATEEDSAKWFGANVSAVGLGSNLISKTMLAKKDFESLKQKTEELLAIISMLRVTS